MNFTQHTIGFVFCFIASVHLFIFWSREWKNVHEGLRGKDKMWQAIEVMAYITFVVWPAMILADTFFGFRASTEAWTSVNIVIAVAVLGISYKTYVQSQEKPKENKPEDQEPQQ